MDINGLLSAVYDENLQALRISPDGGPSGIELDYEETNARTTPVTSVQDFTGLSSITFTVGSRPVYVLGDISLIWVATTAASLSVLITDGSNNVKRTKAALYAANTGGPFTIFERITTPGDYTRKLRIVRNGAGGTITVGSDPASDATYYQSIRAVTG